MAEIKEFWPLLVIVLIALITTTIAGLKKTADSTIEEKDCLTIPTWLTPSAYLALALLFGGFSKLNHPISALYAFFIYGFSVFILYMQHRLPPTLRWYNPIGIAAIITVIFFN